MKNQAVAEKWDRIARFYNWSTWASERRWAPFKKELFSRMGFGKILFLATGTGEEIRLFPEGRQITAIDISPQMLKRAEARALNYNGNLALKQMDARNLSFAADTFDQVFTSCTFCSVPEPIKGLKELFRVIKSGGTLNMFEHTRSRYFPFREILWMMNPVAERIGPSLTRDTVANVRAAGFSVKRIYNIYLDIVKIISAEKQLDLQQNPKTA